MLFLLKLDCVHSDGEIGMRLWLAGMLGVWLSCVALEAQADDFRNVAEASMLLRGTVEINPDGSVHGYAIQGSETLAPIVVEVIQKNLPNWRFQLATTSTTVVKEMMTLRLVAKAVDDKHDAISIGAATFGNPDPDDEHVRFRTRKPPHYPLDASQAGISGTVYLLARVGRDGRVQHVSAEQVNLGKLTYKPLMERYRKDLANAAIAAAKDWTYDVPTKGELVDAPYWYVRVPVKFYVSAFSGEPRKTAPQYGTWEVYIPGPKQDIPWVEDHSLVADAPDAIPDGALHQLGSSTRLATSLGGS